MTPIVFLLLFAALGAILFAALSPPKAAAAEMGKLVFFAAVLAIFLAHLPVR